MSEQGEIPDEDKAVRLVTRGPERDKRMSLQQCSMSAKEITPRKEPLTISDLPDYLQQITDH